MCIIAGGDIDNAESSEQQQLDGDNLTGSKRKERSNAKSVECLDMDGKVLHIFKSGMIASQVLNIGQGDISLCCRGMKRSYMGYRFRFFGDDDKFDYSSKALKKGFGLESEHVYQPRPELMRATRASRGEWQQGMTGAGKAAVESEKRSMMEVKDIKVGLPHKIYIIRSTSLYRHVFYFSHFGHSVF